MHLMRAGERPVGQPWRGRDDAHAAAHASPVMAQRRASERRTTTPSRPIFIQGLARDRVDAASGKRQPPDGDPTADTRARLSWRWGAAS